VSRNKITTYTSEELAVSFSGIKESSSKIIGNILIPCSKRWQIPYPSDVRIKETTIDMKIITI
jgi:hypothetical protein